MARKSKSPPAYPVYKQALYRMCQLQLRICTKLMEMHRAKQPETLMQAARRTILDSRREEALEVVQGLRGVLPGNLLAFLRVGIAPAWEYL
uniref:Transposase n=1 Tax=Panagrellus redivivus TaxID=6233 RepID=A0A7E4VUE4_PANRE